MTDFICVQCKHIGVPKRKKRGSTKLEAFGWMCFPLGLPYTIWRMIAKKPACRHCDGEMLILADSVAGQRLVKIAAGESVIAASTHAIPEQYNVDEVTEEVKPTEKKSRPPQDPNTW
ncbi:MAG: hypothetical protein EBR02_02915 [Alphaproteobacteria bacterium]|nr:hypothetical protein [Alphaproteobacteria bacterium]